MTGNSGVSKYDKIKGCINITQYSELSPVESKLRTDITQIIASPPEPAHLKIKNITSREDGTTILLPTCLGSGTGSRRRGRLGI